MNNYNIKIKTLSPLHIGDGLELTGINFYKDKEDVYVINENKFFRYLEDKNYKEDFYKELKFWAEKGFRQFSENGKKRYPLSLNEYFKNRIKVDFEKNSNYKLKSNYKGRLTKVKTCIKSNNKVYIPGSEIKGAIRTAILYKILKDDVKLLKSFINNRYNIEDLEKKVFRNINNSDAKYDILKNIIISDTDLLQCNKTLETNELFVLNTLSKSNAPMREQVEAIKKDIFFDLKIGFENEKKLKCLKDNIKGSNYNILNIEFIKKSLKEYAGDLLETEINYFKNNENFIKVGKKEKIYNENQIIKLEKLKEENTELNPLIRLGKYKGFLSNTISLLIRNTNEYKYEKDLLLKIENEAKKRCYTKEKSGSNELFPKTRRVSSNNEIFGWCQLVFDNKIIEEENKKLQEQLHKEEKFKKEIELKRKQEVLKRKQELEAENLKLQKEQAKLEQERLKKEAEEKRKQELANMNEMDRKIALYYESNDQDAYLTDLYKELDNLETEDKIKVAKFLKLKYEEMNNWNINKKKKKQFVKVNKIKEILS